MGIKLPTSRLACAMILLLAIVNLLLWRIFNAPNLWSPREEQLGSNGHGGPCNDPNPYRQIAGSGTGENFLCVFTGRWSHLRINFPYIYQSLRKNGGVLDKVYYVMIQYDNETSSKLVELAGTANAVLRQEVFEFRYLNHGPDKTARPDGIFAEFYPMVYAELVAHPGRKYFKMDDDIVYIHPGAFRELIEQQNTSECFLHLANTGGANWRNSYLHQRMGVFDDEGINPKKLRFQFNKTAECGLKSAECAEVALKGFFHHYERQSLETFLFDGRYLMVDRARFTINLFLMDLNVFELKALLDSGPIEPNDEKWWMENYSLRVKNPNCIVGRAFAVHFSYAINRDQILKLGYLSKFEAIANKDQVIHLPKALQNILNFGSIGT